MDQSIITDLKLKFGPAEWFNGKTITKRGWFLLEISPLPPQEEISKVASDIIRNRKVDVLEGRVLHSTECLEKYHEIRSSVVRKAIKRVMQQSFKVAVYTGETELLGRQPVAIVIQPEISYVAYPDHPHLNVGFYDKKTRFYFPDSLCYAEKGFEWGDTESERFRNAFSQISIWLFRHMIWLETRNFVKRGEWIGPGSDPLPGHDYPFFLNPQGMCWCGSKKVYKDCHRHHDLEDLITEIVNMKSISHEEAREKLLHYESDNLRTWQHRILTPSMSAKKNIRNILH